MMRPICFLLSLFLFALPLAIADFRIEDDHIKKFHVEDLRHSVTGRAPRLNVSDPKVKEIAKFAVSEFNKKSQQKLVFEKVLCGHVRLVQEGDSYILGIAVRDESLPNSPIVNYVGHVWEIQWENFRNLEYFYPVIMTHAVDIYSE